MPIPLTGRPDEAAEKLNACREAGARHAVIGISGGDWRAQVDLLAEVRGLLRRQGTASKGVAMPS
ncbi:hypothetical protein MTP10_07915 [Nonomuraea sp. 3-1Str]|uniref:hypothetical protein n=1 Tax=Nonomuraea sp. 3-1Str TaxID=2929801 RepID=UPI0028576D9D|nr:hypothetical protein [Nonomuraea sp. 3-1Str]MDR8408662.1 hypothetical protein [Nonomuraea sp. 3-1Str]